MDLILLLSKDHYNEIPAGHPELEGAGEGVLETLLVSDTCQSYERTETLFIGMDGEIRLRNTKLMFRISGSTLEVVGDLESELVYWNERRMRRPSVRVLRGDCLLAGGVKLWFYRDHVRVCGGENTYQSILEPMNKEDVPFKGFPDYKRSPRVIKRVPATPVEIKTPPAKAGTKKGGLAMLILPPLATASVTVGIGLMMGRGTYLLMSVGATGITIVLSIVRFYSERKELRETNRKRREMYQAYLLRKRKELYQAYRQEEEAYIHNYPDMKELNHMVHSFDSRIYERLMTDQDFLTLSIGKQYLPVSFGIRFSDDGLTIDRDELVEEASQLKREYEMIWKETSIDLKKAHLGLVGDKKIIHQQLQMYLCQLAVFHSYHDLQMIVLYDEKYAAEFGWMKWLPHCRIRLLNVRGLVHSEKSRDQILNSMNQILKERSQKLEESKKEARFCPHYLFVIDEPKYIMDHSIMEYLNGDGDKLGYSIIYTSYFRANLPETIGTVLMLNHAKEGTLLLKEKEFCNESIVLPVDGNVNMELFARDLGVLNHQLGVTSHIPESITFFDMYHILKPEELDVLSRWKSHCAEKSLAVPLGVRGEDDIVELNLHEKAHGPHGLVAGTTGSGKSEIVQSYILSLAVNFHPHEVGFLLIDYKGGGMAGLFRNLPHLLGTITNLDGSESMRALASIKSELARRQKLFGENNVNHINGYMTLFREGTVKEPIPHLFLISDEFAELKKEQPDFMKELVSTARIGRSLGVHLILATQKPTGVVDDQIWTNSKFKLALKVQDESDSKEILKTPDAASITQAGRAYLQVGNNEIYELFQSAWSGAIYIKDQEKEVTLDNRVYLVNELGQRVLINQDLGGSKEEKAAKETQLDVTIDYIHDVYLKENPVPVKKPWLPALERVIVSPYSERRSGKEEKDYRISVPLGVLDIPEEQKQEEYMLNLTEDGNLMYIASSGYGKSVLLTTVALGLALKYTVREVNLFALDFGNNALIALRKLPHTSEYITLDDTERYEKFKKLLTQEIKNRKKRMAECFAQNFQVYNQTSEEPLRAWVILVDNFDAVKEIGFDDEEFFTRVSRDGMSLGIYFVIVASRVNAIRGATYNNFKVKIAGFNFEKGEILNLIGRSPYTLPEVRGRALMKAGERISILQLYAMVPFASDLEYREKINALIGQIRDESNGEEAPHMPIMPEDVDLKSMEQYRNPSINFYVGLETEQVSLEGIRITESPFTILGAPGSGKTNLLKVFLHQMVGHGRLVLFDSPAREFRMAENREGVTFIKSLEQFVSYMDELEAEIVRREKELEGCSAEEEQIVLQSFEQYAVLIDDLSGFYSRETTAEKEIAEMLMRASAAGILLVAANDINKFHGGDPVTEFFKRASQGVLVSSQGYLNVAPVNLEPGEKEGVLYRKGRSVKVRIPQA